jgi:hypothetical protein
MSDNHTGLPHDLPEYVPNVAPEKPAVEETVKVGLGDDYYQGAYFSTAATYLDYEVPRSQLERWEAAQAAYGAMQDEIEQVMREQSRRVLALMLERRKGQPNTVSKLVQVAYEDAITRMLQQAPLLRRKEGE